MSFNELSLSSALGLGGTGNGIGYLGSQLSNSEYYSYLSLQRAMQNTNSDGVVDKKNKDVLDVVDTEKLLLLTED